MTKGFAKQLFAPIARTTFVLSVALLLVNISLAQSKKSGDKGKDDIPQAKREAVEVDESLMNSSPFDLVILKKEAGGGEAKVFPIDFPGRKKPDSPEPNVKITVTMINYPEVKYDVRWKDIEDILLFEDMVLRDAKKLMEAKDFAPAFEHLSYLQVNYPTTPGLDRLLEEFLFVSATSMNVAQKLPHTLAVLEEYQRTFPNSKRSVQVRNAISRVAQQLIQSYYDAGDLRIAQLFVARMKRDYINNPLTVVTEWENKFRTQAEEYREKVEKSRADGNLRDARTFAGKMYAVYPELEGGAELVAETIRQYPMIRVGVFQQSDSPDPTSLTDWAARRSGALTSRSLFEFKRTGAEGGVYESPLGSVVHSDDRKELEMTFRKNEYPIAAADVGQWLLRRATPSASDYNPSWAAILKEVSLDGPERLIVRLRQPHVLPQALLQWKLGDFTKSNAGNQIGSYRVVKNNEDENSFIWSSSEKPAEGRPVEYIEHRYEDSKKAVSNLIQGEIEVIDQLYPSDATTLVDIPDIKVDTYGLPSVHMLVPLSKHPYVSQVDFRRALLYAVNRESVLKGELMGKWKDDQCQLVSGPFPKGKSENDQLSYAYNTNVPDVPYDQGLARLLVEMTIRKLSFMARKKNEKPPTLEKVRLAVPDVEYARIVGEAFIQQWNLLKIPAELVILPKGVTRCTAEEADLIYVTVAVWEPATDAERLFGQGGVAASDDPYIVQALGNLRIARTWTEVRNALQDLHSLVDGHLPVMPLWQMSDVMAYRKKVQGIGQRPLTLYQGLDRWRIKEGKP